MRKLMLLLFMLCSLVEIVAAQSELLTCPGFLTSRLELNQQGRVTPGDPNNLRAEPNLNATSLGQIPGEGVFMVLEGPVCGDNGAWWRVDYNGLVGWTLEGRNDQYWLEPVAPVVADPTPTPADLPPAPEPTRPSEEITSVEVCAGAPLSQLQVGWRARQNLNNDPIRVRATANGADTELRVFPGQEVEVIGGPECAPFDNGQGVWWKVKLRSGFTGWIVEGRADRTFFTPIPVPRPYAPGAAGCEGALPSQLGIGLNAIQNLTQDTLAIRQQPNGDLLLSLYPGEEVQIVGGPLCAPADAVMGTWWEVQTSLGERGWIVEGRPDRAYLVPIVPFEPYAAPAEGCAGIPPTLTIGERALQALSFDNVTARETPGGEAAGFVIPPGQEVTVVAGAMCAPIGSTMGTWWQVRIADSSTGWVLEGLAERRYFVPVVIIEPYAPPAAGCGGVASQLETGIRAVQNNENDGLSIRNAPNGEEILTTIYPGHQVQVVGGPLCAPLGETITTWWEITAPDGTQGWAAEGLGDNYFLAPHASALATPPADGQNCGALPIELAAGTQARQDLNNSSVIMRDAAAGEPIDNDVERAEWVYVISGPLCAPLGGETVTWWEIERLNGDRGWIAEGTAARRFFTPQGLVDVPACTPDELMQIQRNFIARLWPENPGRGNRVELSINEITDGGRTDYLIYPAEGSAENYRAAGGALGQSDTEVFGELLEPPRCDGNRIWWRLRDGSRRADVEGRPLGGWIGVRIDMITDDNVVRVYP